MSLKQNIYRTLKSKPVFWRNILNVKSRVGYLSSPAAILPQPLKNVVNDLNQKGIGFATFEDVFPGESLESFVKEVQQEKEKYLADQYSKKNDEKDFMHFILGLEPTFEKDSLWNKIASHPNLQAIADNYFGLKNCEMRYYNIWLHESRGDEPHGSQLWHRDREDLQILKIFIYLNDVDTSQGPFIYAPSTHVKGLVKQQPEHKLEHGVKRTTDDMMNAIVPKEKWQSAKGKAGTVVFADTHGYHKGGFVREGERLLFTAMYVSPSCQRRYFKSN